MSHEDSGFDQSEGSESQQEIQVNKQPSNDDNINVQQEELQNQQYNVSGEENQQLNSYKFNSNDPTITTEAVTSPSYQYQSWTEDLAGEDDEQLTVSQLEEPQNFLDLYNSFVCLQIHEQEVLQFYVNFQSEKVLQEKLLDEKQNIFNLEMDRKTKIRYLFIKKKLFELFNLSQAFQLFQEQLCLTGDVQAVVVLLKLQLRAFQLCKLTDFTQNGFFLPNLTFQSVPVIHKIIKQYLNQLDQLLGDYKTPFDEDLGLKGVKNEDVDNFIDCKPNLTTQRRQFKLLNIFNLEMKDFSIQDKNKLLSRLQYKVNLESKQIKELKENSEQKGGLPVPHIDPSASRYQEKLRERLVIVDKIQKSKQYYNSQDLPEFTRSKGFRSYLMQKEEKTLMEDVQQRLSRRNERALQKRTPNELYNDIQDEFKRTLSSQMYRSGATSLNGSQSVIQ